MTSKWMHLKELAITLRKNGKSIRDIEAELNIPRSTLSGWLRSIELKPSDRKRLNKRWADALVTARKGAVKWHNAQKEKRLIEAQAEAIKMLSKIDDTNKTHLEIALAFLYLGEGTKKSVITSLGNSDPRILKFFISAIHQLYQVPLTDFKCDLHLRADQDSDAEKRYWSRTLGISVTRFGKSVVDKRTIGTVTYSTYHGVCVVRCSRVALQRKLMYIANMFCDNIAELARG